jgi:hypothetical protein
MNERYTSQNQRASNGEYVQGTVDWLV